MSSKGRGGSFGSPYRDLAATSPVWARAGGRVAEDVARLPATIARPTGQSAGYARRAKAGEVTPHPMWWEQMRQLSGA